MAIQALENVDDERQVALEQKDAATVLYPFVESM
jgi:hypothetical protein